MQKLMKGMHLCFDDEPYGNWQIIENQNAVIRLKHVAPLLTDDKLKTVKHHEICWKGMYDTSKFAHASNQKYVECDIRFPCILIANAPNPKNMKYRMMDGKHRMAKMKAMNIKSSEFYVFDFKEIEHLIDYSEDALQIVKLMRQNIKLKNQIVHLANILEEVKAKGRGPGGIGSFGMINH